MLSPLQTSAPASRVNTRNTSKIDTSKDSIAVVIGRFQPFHRGHAHLINEAARYAGKIVVLIGSSEESCNIKNPLAFEQRAFMIDQAQKDGYIDRDVTLQFKPVRDSYSEAVWIADVRSAVVEANTRNGEVYLVGYEKDQSSSYLSWFPDYNFVGVRGMLYLGDEATRAVSATELREAELAGSPHFKDYPHYLYSIEHFMAGDAFKTLKEEYKYIQDYKASWAAAPFPPTFMCSDAFVMQSGHILLVRRGELPGKGLFALPGGFIDPSETGLDAAIRELREETHLKVPSKVLKGSLFAEKTFDAPGRSSRGRTFSMAYGFHLDDSKELPKVKGGDDADRAFWLPIEHVKNMRSAFFEDHYHIIEWFLDRS